ncbi:hypothetical protein H6P81_018842 [Aristolochia fimbriata]|uniref:Pectinesterase n=1 Tax=Aristolochia fimbriata TaxID=158543 RepID=A0AAV7E2E9_ARIFI|nr:hypothetical protein H6P81_018842 [Aristolochia fimbriata]
MPLTTNETVNRVYNILTWIIQVTGIVLLILGLTVLKPKCPTPEIHPSLVVAQDGSGNFTTVSAAVAAAPSHSRKYFGIFIKPGVYQEEVSVPMEKTRLVFIGGGMGVTVISSNRITPNEWEVSATVVVNGDGFMAIGITFENSGDPTKGGYTVAVANQADKTAFQRCSFKGYNGVLRAGNGFQYYGKSHIYGAEDVIWGRAAAVFQKCAVYVEKPLQVLQASQQQPGALTFQQRSSPYVPGGFVFHGCSVVAAPGRSDIQQPGSVSIFLGRPGGAFSTLVFMGWGHQSLGRMVLRSYSPTDDVVLERVQQWRTRSGSWEEDHPCRGCSVYRAFPH